MSVKLLVIQNLLFTVFLPFSPSARDRTFANSSGLSVVAV